MAAEPSDLARALGVVQSTVTTIDTKEERSEIIKAAQALIQSNAISYEDDPFGNILDEEKSQIIRPPFNPLQLFWLAQNNNMLPVCIAAMEVNVDGTGFCIEKKDGTEDDGEEDDNGDPAEEAVEDFFNEPWPGISFITQRRGLRTDLETCGNAYLEVIRDEAGGLAMLNKLDAKLMRCLRYDSPVEVTKTVTRGGKEVSFRVVERQRRFAQVIENRLVYFKAYGAERELDKATGRWEGTDAEGIGTTVDPKNRATEIIHFTVNPDVLTPYGIPRWISQVPSVLGSRKSEEHNLEFFESGGVPPVMILIAGGQLTSQSREALTMYLAGKSKFKQRAIIAELFSTSGDLNSAAAVKVNVERFGAERQQDSMFEKYDLRCGDRIRASFRLPPLFVGMTTDHNKATAYVSFMIAEAQVFKPERDEFDEMINVTLMKELNPEYVFRSTPVSLQDIESQLKAFDLVKTDIMNDQRVEAINEIAGLSLPVPDQKENALPGQEVGPDGKPATNPDGTPKMMQPTIDPNAVGPKGGPPAAGSQQSGPADGVIAKMEDDVLVELARDWAAYLTSGLKMESENVTVMKTLINVLGPAPKKLFDAYVGSILNPGGHDPAGTAELISCAGATTLKG